MKKLGILLCLVALTTTAFAAGKGDARLATRIERKIALAELKAEKLQKQSLRQLFSVLNNYKAMAAKSTPDQTGMILPAIARVSDVYLADRETYKEAAKLINAPVTFKNGTQMSMTRYIDEFASEIDNLDAFKTALEEDCQGNVEKVANNAGQVAFEKAIAGFNGNANFIGQYVLINLADPMRDMTDEEATPLAKEYATYQVNGVSLVDFCKNPGANWHQSALDELAAFGERVENLAK